MSDTIFPVIDKTQISNLSTADLFALKDNKEFTDGFLKTMEQWELNSLINWELKKRVIGLFTQRAENIKMSHDS